MESGQGRAADWCWWCPQKLFRVTESRLKPLLRAGASPRASINLALAGRARAFMEGRSFVTPQDIKLLARDILRHRILLSYEAEAEDLNSDIIIERILSKVPVP